MTHELHAKLCYLNYVCRRMQEMQIEERESATVIADAIMEGQERRMNATALAKAAAAMEGSAAGMGKRIEHAVFP